MLLLFSIPLPFMVNKRFSYMALLAQAHGVIHNKTVQWQLHLKEIYWNWNTVRISANIGSRLSYSVLLNRRSRVTAWRWTSNLGLSSSVTNHWWRQEEQNCSVVYINCRKIWESGSVTLSDQTVSDYILRQWFSNSQQSRFLTACRRLEKLVLPSIFDIGPKPSILDDVKLTDLSSNSFEWKNVTF